MSPHERRALAVRAELFGERRDFLRKDREFRRTASQFQRMAFPLQRTVFSFQRMAFPFRRSAFSFQRSVFSFRGPRFVPANDPSVAGTGIAVERAARQPSRRLTTHCATSFEHARGNYITAHQS